MVATQHPSSSSPCSNPPHIRDKPSLFIFRPTEFSTLLHPCLILHNLSCLNVLLSSLILTFSPRYYSIAWYYECISFYWHCLNFHIEFLNLLLESPIDCPLQNIFCHDYTKYPVVWQLVTLLFLQTSLLFIDWNFLFVNSVSATSYALIVAYV